MIDGNSYSGSTAAFPFEYEANQNTASSSEAGPKAYLNWLVFDRDYNFKLSKSGYDRLSSTPKEHGQDVAHEPLFSPEIVIDEPGYVYIYLSNEEGTPLEVYFDDFKVEHTRSPVVQMDDYYPFGLTFNSYERENAIENQYLFAGKERQDELEIGWLDFGARMYQPEIARWNGVDASSENYVNQSPYHYAGNNPVIFVDYDGNDYGVSVNHNARTITIQAHFITNGANARAFNTQGRDKWNAQSGRNVFITGSIKDLKQGRAQAYSIEINVTSEIDNGPGANGRSAGDNRAAADQTGTVNSFDTVKEFPRNERQNGGTSNNEVTVKESEKNGGTTTHETSHAMGNGHTTEGGTLDIHGGTSVSKSNVAETLKGVGIGGNTAQRNAGNGTGDGTLLNGSTNQGLEQGRVITQRRYERIMRRIERREERNQKLNSL